MLAQPQAKPARALNPPPSPALKSRATCCVARDRSMLRALFKPAPRFAPLRRGSGIGRLPVSGASRVALRAVQMEINSNILVTEEAAPQARPTYHLAPTQGWLNDPNGPFYHNGKYHMCVQIMSCNMPMCCSHRRSSRMVLCRPACAAPCADCASPRCSFVRRFYQHLASGCEWAFGLGWGHAVSEDLINWRQLPMALTPGPEDGTYDLAGCFSGCAAVDVDGNPMILYTGAFDVEDYSVTGADVLTAVTACSQAPVT